MKARLVLVIVVLALVGGGVAIWKRGASSPVVAEKPPGVVRVSDDHWEVPRSMKEEYFQDPQRLNREFRLRPTPGPGADAIRSLEVDFVAEGSPMQAAGFRKGDVILEVNGSAVATMSRALSLSQEIRRSEALTVRLEREGRPRTLRVEFPDATAAGRRR